MVVKQSDNSNIKHDLAETNTIVQSSSKELLQTKYILLYISSFQQTSFVQNNLNSTKEQEMLNAFTYIQ